ncbi:MAG: NADH-quinone oxidoreductase subunit NuoH [Planctomycetes bacterium]|nr:NADH-quinone oxidoreductase subunit NuoH [Planctomycetota bacterium]MBT6452811.1 NADH-quinone oxidoreductase subunit NuoH [Planctomycetota bacterium]MBT6541655.1 NADH-quinone oxidoreductase subunit NuoH [Planctomycetota bacterium]MBT6785570.1 NADH-quinone oxidoreductase subunit NuoH [Planctomycetota bacterium]MBT6967574.1 NADH-quinone oxidoreductase subunit NuoH [Planctomycetota bacterium]
MTDPIYEILIAILKAVIIFAVLLQIVPLLVYFERRICAWIQDRIGPNRVGPVGLLQPLADVIKLAFKEDLTPQGADKWIYRLAPVLVYAPAVLAFTVIPVGIDLQVATFDIGVIFLFTISGFSVYGLAFGGWASNNKYSLLGGLRASAQMISYEVAMGLSIIAILMTAETVDLNEIVRQQWGAGTLGLLEWNLFQQPIAAVVFMIAAFAETNRLPFDLAECEAELIGGFHTEYTGLKFATFFMGEYVAMITMSGLMITLFLGGWSVPWVEIPTDPSIFDVALSVGFFTVKLFALLFFYIWTRWTLPRFRYDQLMRIGWKVFIPVSLANIGLTAIAGVLGWKWLIPLP